MSERAEVSSIQAIADFRTALLVYIGKVKPLLDDSADEVFRTREWLRVTRRVQLENEIRLRTRQFTDAQQALFSAELSRLREPSSAEVQAVQAAKRALAAAEEKLQRVKRVSSSFDKETDHRVKHIERLRAIVATDLPLAAHFLERVVETLDRYASTAREAPPRVEKPAAAQTSGAEEERT
jgi:hypothetical protein